jgi:O-antigen/teichoic acid export membrane protein
LRRLHDQPAIIAWVVTVLVFVGVNVVLLGSDMSPIYFAAVLAALAGWITLMIMTRRKEKRLRGHGQSQDGASRLPWS